MTLVGSNYFSLELIDTNFKWDSNL